MYAKGELLRLASTVNRLIVNFVFFLLFFFLFVLTIFSVSARFSRNSCMLITLLREREKGIGIFLFFLCFRWIEILECRRGEKVQPTNICLRIRTATQVVFSTRVSSRCYKRECRVSNYPHSSRADDNYSVARGITSRIVEGIGSLAKYALAYVHALSVVRVVYLKTCRRCTVRDRLRYASRRFRYGSVLLDAAAVQCDITKS